MNLKFEHKPELTLIGYSTTIPCGEGFRKCPEFWDLEYSRKYARLLETMKPETAVEKAILENRIGAFAICNDRTESFDYWIAGLYTGGEVPEGLRLFTIPESDWALFTAKGALPDSLQNLSTHILNEWFPNEGRQYALNGSAMLEVYSEGDMQSSDYECGIWIPIVKK